MVCSSISPEMASAALGDSSAYYEGAASRAGGWRRWLARMRQPRRAPRREAVCECFGALAAKDAMVVKGLAINRASASVNATKRLRVRAATSAADAAAVASRSARVYDEQ
jgi:hypothetical protein